MSAARDAALALVSWARIWSPLAPADARDEAWQALALPGCFADCEAEFLATFVVGLPAPPVPLLLHAALGRDGGAVREDWMRVMAHLALRFGDRSLPPDHLGAACELLACAIEHDDTVLIHELVKRYFMPWTEVAARRVADARHEAIARLPGLFATDLSDLRRAPADDASCTSPV